MILSVTLYKNTGLSPGNVVDDLSLLTRWFGGGSIEVPNPVAVKQEKGIISIKVNIQYTSIESVDYAIIGKFGYWVTGITMLNDNVCMLELSCDYFSSVGLSSIVIVGGWCTRRHVNDDTLFSNTIPEPFTPTEIMKVDLGGTIQRSGGYSEDLNIVISTTDLSVSFYGEDDSPVNLAQPWQIPASLVESLGTTVGLFTPRINNLSVFTNYYMTVNVNGYSTTKETQVPYTSAFNLNSQAVQSEIAQMYSIGLDNVILDSYILPGKYIENVQYYTPSTIDSWISALTSLFDKTASRSPNCLISRIGCTDSTVSSKLSATFGSYKNNKVYSGQFQKIVLLSRVSGETVENDIEDILNSSNSIMYKVGADVRYNGRPFVYPAYYKGTTNSDYICMVSGSEWQKSPIKQIGSSGYLSSRVDRVQGIISNGVGSAIGAAASPLEGLSNVGDIAKNIAQPAIGEVVSNTLGTGYIEAKRPNLNFCQIPSLQNYIGNDFYDYRIRLSDGDMRRFDEFLTQFGYAVNETLTKDCFTGRMYFNYVKAESVSIKLTGVSDLAIIQGVKSAIEAGVRVWHTAPNQAYLTDNPIGG